MIRATFQRLTFVAIVAIVSSALSLQAEDLQKLKKAIKKGDAVLLDVREKDEWDNAHLEHTVFASFTMLSQDGEAKKLVDRYKQKNPKIKIYCFSEHGKRAKIAAARLKELIKADAAALSESYTTIRNAGFKEHKKGETQYDPRIKL